MTPLTHDDWTWAIHFGTDRLGEWFKDYNGRYLGNLTEILITRSSFIRYFLMGVLGAALVVLPLLIARTSKWTLSFLSFFSCAFSSTWHVEIYFCLGSRIC